jgi:hypothetical protein
VFSRRSIEGVTFFVGYNNVLSPRARGELVVPVPVPHAERYDVSALIQIDKQTNPQASLLYYYHKQNQAPKVSRMPVRLVPDGGWASGYNYAMAKSGWSSIMKKTK